MDLAFLRTLFSPFSGKVLLAGFSGGADSTAALLCAAMLQKELSFTLIAIHMNHHLRGKESDHEAENAAVFARAHHIAFEEISLSVSPGKGLEAHARKARIAAWKTATARYPGSAVILGHHAGDRMENLLLRLGRGVNLSGAIGLRARSEVDGVTFLRPIYHWTREEVEVFLRTHGITEWAQDSSNSENITPRNTLRNRILPELRALYPGKEKGIIRSLDLWEKDAEFLEELARRRLASPRAQEAAFWAETPAVLLCRMLRYAWEARGGSGDFSHDTVERFQRFLLQKGQGKIPLGGGRQALIFRGKLLFEREAPLSAAVVWQWKQQDSCRIGRWRFFAALVETWEKDPDCQCAFFPAETLPEALILGFPGKGEKMVPFGRKTPIPLKDLRVKAHCPAALTPPLLKSPQGGILWFPGIRRGNFFPLSPGEKAVRISVQKEPDLPEVPLM